MSRWLLFVAGLLILTAGSMGWASYVVARGIIREQIHERLRVAATDRHAMVLSFVAQQLERVGLVASRTRMRTLIAQHRLGEIAKEKFLAEALPILIDARGSSDGFRGISIADLNGIVIASTDPAQLDRNVAQDLTFRAGLNDRHLGEPVLVEGEHVATLSAPARNNAGELVGVVLVEFDATPLFEILSNTLGLGASGEILIGTRDGQNVRYLFDEKRDASRSKTLNDLPAMAAAIGGATRSEVLEYDGVESIVHYRPIEYQPPDVRPWGLLAKVDLSEAYVPLDDYRRALLWIQACLFVVGLAGSFWLSRRLTRPIVALTETAMAVTAGDLAAQVTVTTDDEIGVLSRTFNAMTRQLQMSYATLEERVARRTVELSDEIARREEMQQELQQNAERIQRIIDTANDAFITMDSAGKIIEWNPQARTMFGWSRDEVLDKSLADTIVPPNFREIHTRGLQRFLETREARVLDRRLELTAQRRDGSVFPIELTISPQRLRGGFVFNAFLHDITDRKAGEQLLHEAREVAEAANRSKSEFLANMSHEIRTPMNGIIGMTELLAGTRLEPEQEDFLNMTRQSADALLRLLNDILDFSKIEAGKLELETISFSLRECIGDAGQTLATRASEKGIELAFRVAPEIPDVLIGDPGRLRQIVVNLAGNAIKFTQEGEVVINVAIVTAGESASDTDSDSESAHDANRDAKPDSKAASQPDVRAAADSEDPAIEERRLLLKVSVRDTGIGIPTDKQRVIFEAFGQVDASTTRRYGGTGLGLAICTQLVEMMHGEINVDSEVGQGTTFSFTAEFGVAKRQELPRRAERSVLLGLQVLIVDDNQTNRRIMQEVLESWNMKPQVADSGTVALDLIQQAQTDGQPIPLVLLDCMMPEMDGFEFARRLREIVGAKECAMMMLSSAIQPGDNDRCRKLGIARCMVKPVKHSDLLNAILSEFNPAAMIATETKSDRLAVPTTDARRILLAEDGIVNQRVAVEFLERRGHEVVVVEDGAKAVEAVARERFDLVLMDVQMPIMDGFEATVAIRASEVGTDRHMSIVAMTANAMKGDRERCLQAGMDDYVAKPIDATRLFAAIESIPARVLAERNAARKQVPAEVESASALREATSDEMGNDAVGDPKMESGGGGDSRRTLEPQRADELDGALEPQRAHDSSRVDSTSVSLIDWEVARVAIPGGESVARELAALLQVESRKMCEQMRAAIDGRDAETLRRAAHTLKGSAAIFEVTSIVDSAEHMESIAKADNLGDADSVLRKLETLVARMNDELSAILS